MGEKGKTAKAETASLSAVAEQESDGKTVTVKVASSEMRGLIEKAMKGDEVAMGELRKAVGDDDRFWGAMGKVAEAIVQRQLKMLCGKNLVVGEGMKRHLSVMRSELAGPGDPPLERLLADRIAVCWLQLQHADSKWLSKLDEGMSLREGDYYQRWQDRAHRRFLSACKTLATVRKLAVPALQVNIGDKQVNIAGPQPP